MYISQKNSSPYSDKKFASPLAANFPHKMAMMKISASFLSWNGRPCRWTIDYQSHEYTEAKFATGPVGENTPSSLYRNEIFPIEIRSLSTIQSLPLFAVAFLHDFKLDQMCGFQLNRTRNK